jgi:hypothetical protein
MIRHTTSMLAVAAALALAASAPAAAQTPAACPATFQVLHDDAIGALALPAGPYRITVVDPARLSCAHAADLFRQFLEDWDGRLPSSWELDPATATFTGASGAAFSIARTDTPSGGGGGQHPATGLRCPGTFQVLHDDRIGSFRVPAGQYTLTLLSAGSLSCGQASRRFASFLQDFDGRLAGRWVLHRATATFQRGSAAVGFRVEPAVGPAPPPTPGGGGTHPAGDRCPGTFQVLHDDSIGRLQLPAGRYRITQGASGRPSCSLASRYLARFLRAGDVSPGWRLDTATATFSSSSSGSFRIKRVRQPR